MNIKKEIKKIDSKACEIMIYEKCNCDCDGWNTGKCSDKCKKCINCSKKCASAKKILNIWPLDITGLLFIINS